MNFKELFQLALLCVNVILWGEAWGVAPTLVIIALMVIISSLNKGATEGTRKAMILTWASAPIMIVYVVGAVVAAWTLWSPVFAIAYICILLVAMGTELRSGESSHDQPEV